MPTTATRVEFNIVDYLCSKNRNHRIPVKIYVKDSSNPETNKYTTEAQPRFNLFCTGCGQDMWSDRIDLVKR